jgi:(2Fe-2S) ferredoxin
VCCNARPVGDRPACGSGGGARIVAELAAAIASNPDLRGHAAVTESGCLGPCFDGPNLVVYPDGVWYAGVTAADVPELVAEHLLAGRPVERLIYRWSDDASDDDDDES